jgi:carbon monoxide dehydrogenase subunit G
MFRSTPRSTLSREDACSAAGIFSDDNCLKNRVSARSHGCDRCVTKTLRNPFTTTRHRYPIRRFFVFVLLAATLAALFAIPALADSGDSIAIGVRIQDEEVFVDVNFHVPATPREVWAVITDYDHATAFISKLEKSVILSRTADTLLVSQKGTMGLGPFSLAIETVTEVRLTPYETLHGRMLSGNMKKNESVTTLHAEAGGTRIVYHLESIPEVWMPPVIGRALVEFETRARFRQLRDEILRRKALPEAAR